MRDFLYPAISIALTLCGTMIGAGFASGQELLQFFIAYGRFGLAGVACAGLLFAAVAWRLLAVSRAHLLRTHRDLIYLLCGRRAGRFFDLAVSLFLFVLFVLMLAGANAASQDLPLPDKSAGLCLAALAACAAKQGSASVARINSAATPLLATAIILVCASSLSYHGWQTAAFEEAALAIKPAPHWLLGCALYVAYNFALGATVLVPLGRGIKKTAACAAGSILGGALLAGLSALIVLTLLAHAPHIFAQQIPMLHISCSQSLWHTVLYALVLLLSMFTTASTCLYGCACKLQSATGLKALPCLLLCAGAALPLSSIGFNRIIAVLFPLFGYLSLFLLLRLFTVKSPRQRRNAP